MTSIDEAFKKIDRANFVPERLKNQVDFDEALPIGFGQTVSQPTTVAYMLEWLDVQSGDKVLDIGSGSGWTTALLSELVGPQGTVYAVERIPELLAFGETNCAKSGITNARFFQAGKHYGLPEHAPYDRILVSAAAETLPDELLDQLAIGGRLVIPVQNDIWQLSKTAANNYDIRRYPGFVFVPLKPAPFQ